MPPAPFFVGIGARHHGEEAGLGRVGDEALGAVEHLVVAVADARVVRSAGRVGAGIGLGQRERAR